MAYSITGAPRIGNGIVFIGEGGGEFYTRGFLAAHDAQTGKALWRFWTVPGNPAKGPDNAASDSVMPMAASTWTGEWWQAGGGGTVWDGILYDPQTDSVIFGTGNGIPWPARLRSPEGGDNLFIASIVALDAKTGKYKWHYQTTPMEGFDFDSTSPLTVADITVGGEKKHVVMQAPKNGVMYVIEVATGKVVSADPFVPSIN
jgi:quinohemoprotein ethanol dehydrogenase